MTELRSTIFQRGEARFDMVGRKLPFTLREDEDQAISAGLVNRLRRYALKELAESGFDVETWDCEVYTMDGDDLPSDRAYAVDFINSKGGKLGVHGILTSKGHPCLDHGIFADRP